MADSIFDDPELGFQEFHAQKKLTDYLTQNGFQVETGTGGVKTAFRAEFRNGQGGPRIGLLCEYDALEGLGHACGHHMQGPAIVGAAKALKDCAGDRPSPLWCTAPPRKRPPTASCGCWSRAVSRTSTWP